VTIKIIDITKNPLSRMGEVASTCWNTKPLTAEHLKQIGIDCIDSGHHRPVESIHLTIAVEGYSARMIRELYTHIGGSPMRLQESTRYVDCSNFDYYLPDSIKNNENAFIEYEGIMQDIQNSYKHLQELNIPKQDIANILPLGMMTKIAYDINLRTLLHMAEVRLCKRALKEYRDFMYELRYGLEHEGEEWQYIMDNYYKPKCEIAGYCIEKNTCGMMSSKKIVLNS
jgi:thymidylate synthase (FAD)